MKIILTAIILTLCSCVKAQVWTYSDKWGWEIAYESPKTKHTDTIYITDPAIHFIKVDDKVYKIKRTTRITNTLKSKTMRRKSNALQLSFVADGENYEAKIRRKITELQARKAALIADCEKIIPQGSPLLNYFEQKSVDKQIELLNWVLNE